MPSILSDRVSFFSSFLLFYRGGEVEIYVDEKNEARNSDLRSYVISDGQGYIDSPVVSTKFEIFVSFLSSYCVTLNQTAFVIKGSFTFLCIL